MGDGTNKPMVAEGPVELTECSFQPSPFVRLVLSSTVSTPRYFVDDCWLWKEVEEVGRKAHHVVLPSDTVLPGILFALNVWRSRVWEVGKKRFHSLLRSLVNPTKSS